MNIAKKYAIIVAAGQGLRTGEKHPKQFALLNGLPVILHSMRAFHSAFHELEIILVMNQEHNAYWEEILRQYDVPPHIIVYGGVQRFDSVKNALATLQHSDSSLIAVHDAARPLIKVDLIVRLFEAARDLNAVVPGIKPADSVRSGSNSNNHTTDRNSTFLIQTPQVFKGAVLQKAYQTTYHSDFTDDASVVEKAGFAIHIADGEKENFKITFPGDHTFAEIILKLRNENI